MIVGALALQGSFQEHIDMLTRMGVEAIPIRKPDQLAGIDGLIIPGGESTTIGKLATTYELIEPLREFGSHAPIWGTCAGAIFLSKDARRDQPLLGLMNITVERNAFGRQVDSFEIDLSIAVLEQPEEPFHAIFIRAPLIESVGPGVDVLAELDSSSGGARIVAAREDRLLATSFHPELTRDDRFHRYFIRLIEENNP
ncbi:MAG: pyridoxal 5'-phosphate synthase glutaminase subunit PdxT [Anaerolineales bacterium]|jgi:5'-phosphate synthase pdxT subunit